MPDNAAQQLLAIGEVARLLDLPVHAVRRWIDYHAAHLSESARPETTGTPRRLTGRDVEVLRTVKQLRSQGLTVAVINERLASLTIGEIEPATALQPSPPAQDDPSPAQTALVVVEAMQSVLAPLSARIEALEAQRPTWRDVILFVLAAFLAGLIVGLAVWWFQ